MRDARLPRQSPRQPALAPSALSPRLAAIVDALPLRPQSRVLERSAADPALPRERSQPGSWTGHILAIDRSASAIAQVRAAAADEIAAGRPSVRQTAVEDLILQPDEEPYNMFAVRVGALDGRHPKAGKRALQRIAAATTVGARLFIDGGDPLRDSTILRS